jgi:hypothetical protein
MSHFRKLRQQIDLFAAQSRGGSEGELPASTRRLFLEKMRKILFAAKKRFSEGLGSFFRCN